MADVIIPSHKRWIKTRRGRRRIHVSGYTRSKRVPGRVKVRQSINVGRRRYRRDKKTGFFASGDRPRI